MEVKESEERSLVLVRGRRDEAAHHPELRDAERPASNPIISELDRAAVFAAELRLTIVRRACGWRLGPSNILSAVAVVLGKLAATLVRGDGERLGPLIEELHCQIRDAAAAALRPREVP